MGLDMYLMGSKTPMVFQGEQRKEDGFPISKIVVDLGYWRKHPNLHGYIVQSFAEGLDECQSISLDAEDLEKISEAIKNGDLPVTAGFFFGESRIGHDQVEHDLDILGKAIKWVCDEKPGEYRSVVYQASW